MPFVLAGYELTWAVPELPGLFQKVLKHLFGLHQMHHKKLPVNSCEIKKRYRGEVEELRG